MRTAILNSQPWQCQKLLYSAVVIAAALRLILMLHDSPTSLAAGFRLFGLPLSQLLILVLEVIIWFLGARSAQHFKNYAVSIKSTDEGRAMNNLANGLLWLVAYTALLTFTSSLIALFDHTPYDRMVTMLAIYLPLSIAVLASMLLFVGSAQLVSLMKRAFWTPHRILYFLLAYAVLMLSFIVEFYVQSPFAQNVDGNHRFVMPTLLVMLTYVLPYVLIWLAAIVASINLAWYTQNVDGRLYKTLFRNANRGIALVFVCTFLAQLLICSPFTETQPVFDNGLTFGVLILLGIGFSLIYRGAKQLECLEESG